MASLNAVKQYKQMLDEEKQIIKNNDALNEQKISIVKDKIIFPENTMIGALYRLQMKNFNQ